MCVETCWLWAKVGFVWPFHLAAWLPHNICLGCVNYKLALAKSIASDQTARAFAFCFCRGWTLCCCSCWPSTPPEGVQGRVRHYVLQGIWWDRSLDGWMLSGTDFMITVLQFSSVQSLSVLTLLPPHGLQHARLPCPSPAPRACSNSCPSSWWCHPTISPSVIPFSSCLQTLLASGSFSMSCLFASSGESVGASASTSVLPVNIQDWFPLG